MNKDEIEKIGIRELRKNLPKYLSGESPLEVLRHGHTIGYYFPIQQQSKIAEITALSKIAKQLEEILKEKGISEDDVIKEFRQLRAEDRKKAENK